MTPSRPQEGRWRRKGAATPGLSTDWNQGGGQYCALRAQQHFHIWSIVFSGADRDRLVFVVSGQTGNDGLAGLHLDIVNSATFNPRGVKPDAYAVAPCLGRGLAGTDRSVTVRKTDLEPTPLGPSLSAQRMREIERAIVSALGIVMPESTDA